ncbi:MAG: AtpZ/AtpI family protein [Bacteroidetes bacterium]|nr:AtpZ/AtpI family protein [Bacteroidota bacterium]
MNPDQKKPVLNAYARYSGMGLQMLVIIVLGVFGGVKLDHWLNVKPLFTIILSLGSVILAIYYVTRDLLKKNNNKE